MASPCSSFDLSLPITQTLPGYFAKTNYKNPEGMSYTPARHALGEEYFDYLRKNPEKSVDFDFSMRLEDSAPPHAQPVYPFAERMAAGLSSHQEDGHANGPNGDVVNGDSPQTNGQHAQAVAIVDMGGGQGQFLERIIRENPGLPGRFVLQDMATTIKPLQARKDIPFEPTVHDLFTPQPIKGKH